MRHVDDDLLSRRRNAAAAFIARRGELGMTQEEVAAAAGVAYRTVQNFEAGVWPNPRTRSRLERALRWPAGEIQRLASPPEQWIDQSYLDRSAQLTDAQKQRMVEWFRDQLAATEDSDGELRRA